MQPSSEIDVSRLSSVPMELPPSHYESWCKTEFAGAENTGCSDRILTCRIKSIRSPAKGGTGCYRFNYQPGS